MDGLSAAANTLAVIDVGAKLAALCFQYAVAVKSAKDDIETLGKAVDNTRTTLEELLQLLNKNDKLQLPATHKLSLAECGKLFTQLKGHLEPGKRRKALQRIGVKDLKWPFTSKQVENMVASLERYQQTFSLALQVDQTLVKDAIIKNPVLFTTYRSLTIRIDRKTNEILSKLDTSTIILPTAAGASFHSHRNEHESTCLDDTRVDLLMQISEWAGGTGEDKPIFWLKGMAGTGKSTIARTVAKSFSSQRQLGASFFFKRGEGERGNAARFFTTIAMELMTHLPDIRPSIEEAIDAEPTIAERSLKDQFEKLILQPLSKAVLLKKSPLVMVIDALDECERDEDIRTILQLLPQTKSLISIRIFVTSRPELPIRLGFKRMPDGTYQDLVLHEVAKATIEHDISIYLEHELSKIRDDRNLASDWPGHESVQTLVDMAVPLFIFATTICRFVGETSGNPMRRLQEVLSYESEESKLDRTYLPILNSLFATPNAKEKAKMSKEFQTIVGSIVLLERPLSLNSLAGLLAVSKDDISCRLDSLHSVLSIPDDNNLPIRLLHLSFREFLVDCDKKESPFWVYEHETHRNLTLKCLQVMSAGDGLRQNMCDLSPHTAKEQIDKNKIETAAPPHLQYACRYWIHHLEKIGQNSIDFDIIYAFLKDHFIHWLECMSIIGETDKCIHLLQRLQLFSESSNTISNFVRNAKRFVLRFQDMVAVYPLQLYYSGLNFAPQKSVETFNLAGQIPNRVDILSGKDEDWDACRSVFENHIGYTRQLVFSPDSELLITASDGESIRIHNTVSGTEHSRLEGHSGLIRKIDISPNGRQIVSGSEDRTVRLWEISTGACVHIFEGHTSEVRSVSFSSDGESIVSSSDDGTVRIWSVESGTCQMILLGHSKRVDTAMFSPDGNLVASASRDFTIRLWETSTGLCRYNLENHTDYINSLAFSPDGTSMISAANNCEVIIWDVLHGRSRKSLYDHLGLVHSVCFSPDGLLIASASSDTTVQLYNSFGTRYHTLKGHTDRILVARFSPDSKRLASGSGDGSIRLWVAATGICSHTFNGHYRSIYDVAFSPDGLFVASASSDRTTKLWDAMINPAESSGSITSENGHSKAIVSITVSSYGRVVASVSDDLTVRIWNLNNGSCEAVFRAHFNAIRGVIFSADDLILASYSKDKTVQLWDLTSGKYMRTCEGHTDYVRIVTFSSDNQLLASGADNGVIIIWQTSTGICLHEIDGHRDFIRALVFSGDNQLVASGGDDGRLKVWDVGNGKSRQVFENHPDWVTAISFSPDQNLIVSGCGDALVRIHDVVTGTHIEILKGQTWVIDALAFSKDGKSLASASSRGGIRGWEIKEAKAHTEAHWSPIDIQCRSVNCIKFSQDGQYLHTNRGDIPIHRSSDDECLPQNTRPANVFVQDQWILCDSEPLTLLPAEFRGSCCAVSKDVVCLGSSSGRMTFLRIRPE